MASAFGARLRRLREAKKLTLQQVADAVGCTKAYIWELEMKDGQRPSAERVHRLAKTFGVTVEVAVHGAEALERLGRAMQREGHEVVLARTGDEALEAIRREKPALVLLDVMMPGKSGLEVCQAVRADESLAGVKILMLTAKGRDTDIAQGRGVGADDYMTKPFSTKELAARVRGMLGGTP